MKVGDYIVLEKYEILCKSKYCSRKVIDNNIHYQFISPGIVDSMIPNFGKQVRVRDIDGPYFRIDDSLYYFSAWMIKEDNLMEVE